MILFRKFANTRSMKAQRDYFALAESQPTPGTLVAKGPLWINSPNIASKHIGATHEFNALCTDLTLFCNRSLFSLK